MLHVTNEVTIDTSQETFVGLEDVLKTSSTRLQRNNFTSSKMSWRRLEDILQDVLKTFWKTKNCYAEDVLKTFWRHVLKTSWRHYGDKPSTYWGYLCLTNLNVYLTNLYLTNLHLTILKRIQDALSRTHHFNICPILELKQHHYVKN